MRHCLARLCEALQGIASCQDSIKEEMQCKAGVALALAVGSKTPRYTSCVASRCEVLHCSGPRRVVEVSMVHELCLQCRALVSCPGCH